MLKILLNGLACANCANKIEKKVHKLKGVETAGLNYFKKHLLIECSEEDEDRILNEVSQIVKKLEPDVEVLKVE